MKFHFKFNCLPSTSVTHSSLCYEYRLCKKKRSYCVTHFTSPWSSILIIRQIATTFAAADDFLFLLLQIHFNLLRRVKLMRRRWQSFAIKPHQLGEIHLAVICKLNMSTLRESMTEQGSEKCGKWRKEVKMMRCSCSLLLSRSRTKELFITIQLATCKKKGRKSPRSHRKFMKWQIFTLLLHSRRPEKRDEKVLTKWGKLKFHRLEKNLWKKIKTRLVVFGAWVSASVAPSFS